MRFESTTRDLVLATWLVEPAAIAPVLPDGLEAALGEDGRGMVSLVGLRNRDVRLAGWPGPGFAQVTVRTYVEGADGAAILVLAIRVGPVAIAGALFGVPLRPARIRVEEGLVRARGIGVSLRYRLIGEARSVPVVGGVALGTHEMAYVVSAGLRRIESCHEPFRWHKAELLDSAVAEPVLALGFDVQEPDSLLYAKATRFGLDLPPPKVADSGR